MSTSKTAFRVSAAELASLASPRDGETKLGQVLACYDGKDDFESFLRAQSAKGVRWVVIGVAEDIGPRANCGRGGADGAWSAFLGELANIQANRFLSSSLLAVAGCVDLSDIISTSSGTQSSPEELRKICEQIDERVAATLQLIFAAGMEPIVIGGGHNNALPLIRAHQAASQANLGCCNLDVHLDFRRLEGRHSGNSFSYASAQGMLHAYFAIGTKESYNSEYSLASMQEARFCSITFEDLFVRKQFSLEQALNCAVNYFLNADCRVGLELDLDSINGQPASNPVVGGFSLEQGADYVFSLASRLPCAYLHLPEGAPIHASDGGRTLGRGLVELLAAYVKGRAHCCLL